MTYAVILRPAARKEFLALDKPVRIRVGTYRVVYTIEDDRLVVVVAQVGHRREVYERGDRF